MASLPSDAALWSLVMHALERLGVSWQQLLLAWGRVLPFVTIVPAFGSRLMPAPARAVFGIGLAALLVPAVAQQFPASDQSHWIVGFIGELLRGLPVALSAGGLIWAATMAGGLVDDLRGASQQQSLVFQDARTPLATFVGLFAITGFLQLGGVEATLTLLTTSATEPSLPRAVHDLVQALRIAFALSAPVLCVSVVWEVAGALIARAASPAHIQALLAPLRALVVLGAFALVLPAFFELLVTLLRAYTRGA